MHKFNRLNSFTIENISLFLEKNKSNLKLLDKNYCNQNAKMEWLCDCGRKFRTSWTKVKDHGKRQCNDCGKEISKNKRRFPLSKIKEILSKKSFYMIDESEYKHTENFINVIDKDGYKYLTSVKNIKVQRPCAFHVDNPHTVYNMNNYIKINKIDVKLNSKKWEGNSKKYNFTCSCGRDFETTWGSFTDKRTSKTRCGICSRKISQYEGNVLDFLNEININYVHQYKDDKLKYKNSLFFDFMLFLENGKMIAIEVNGIQHYKPIDFGGKGIDYAKKEFKNQQKKDRLKFEFCKNNNIGFIELKYDDIKNNNYKKIIINSLKVAN